MPIPSLRVVKDRAEFDALLAAATNYEKIPDFHAGRIRVDLTRMREYVERLHHPERASPVVHITGTKGKGSTAAMVARVLGSLGGRTGLHTSPHLHKMEERVLVDFQPIAEDRLLAATNRVLEAAQTPTAIDFPTYFELMTLVAFLEFEARGCAFAVHEVGMGGSLDATNVVLPAVTAITNIALEHTAVLGATLEAIAREKAGIVKPGAPVLTGAEGAALPPIEAAAARAGVPLHRLGRDLRVEHYASTHGGVEVGVATWRTQYPRIRLALHGRHQGDNLALALGIVDVLRDQRLLDATDDAIAESLHGFFVPCRFETVASSPTVIVDGAHTPESIAAAVATARGIAGDRPLVVVFALARDKDATRAAQPLASCRHVVTTTYGNERQSDPGDLAAAVRAAGGVVTVDPDPKSALASARKFADKEGLVLVVGSLYLAAQVRESCVGGDAPLYPPLVAKRSH